MALPFTSKRVSSQGKEKNYKKNSNISPCKNIIFGKKSSKIKKPKCFKILL